MLDSDQADKMDYLQGYSFLKETTEFSPASTFLVCPWTVVGNPLVLFGKQ